MRFSDVFLCVRPQVFASLGLQLPVLSLLAKLTFEEAQPHGPHVAIRWQCGPSTQIGSLGLGVFFG